MQKPAEILDREREWEELVRFWQRKGPDLLFVLGRWWVGKSYP
jgi:AAA+ ATPase superfamily predicted ATPase